MTSDDKKTRVIVIDGPAAPNARQLLAAMYGAGLVRQGQMAGEYPPPPVDMPKIEVAHTESTLSPGSGTITGRMSRNKPPFHELYGGPPCKLSDEPADLNPLIEADYSKLEERVLAWWNNKPEPVVSRVNLSQMLTQANAAAEEMESWAEKMRADGWVQGTGAAHDEWTKIDD